MSAPVSTSVKLDIAGEVQSAAGVGCILLRSAPALCRDTAHREPAGGRPAPHSRVSGTGGGGGGGVLRPAPLHCAGDRGATPAQDLLVEGRTAAAGVGDTGPPLHCTVL